MESIQVLRSPVPEVVMVPMSECSSTVSNLPGFLSPLPVCALLSWQATSDAKRLTTAGSRRLTDGRLLSTDLSVQREWVTSCRSGRVSPFNVPATVDTASSFFIEAATVYHPFGSRQRKESTNYVW